MLSWRSTASNIYSRCIGVVPSATLTAAVVYHEIESSREWMPQSFFVTPILRKRELRHIIVPCGNINFDIYVLGTNHQTARSNEDVKRLLNLVRPDVIFVELCRGREEMLYDESYDKSEYYAAAEYRRGEQAKTDKQTKMPFLMLGDRPVCVSDQRWFEGIKSAANKIVAYLVWPFILPLRDRLWGHEILISERDTFMAYELHKSCAYYIEQQQEQNANETSTNNPASDRMSICTKLVAMNRAQKSSLTLDAFLQSTCLDTYSYTEQPKQPSVVAIIGSNHLEGVCKLLENERVWSPQALSEVVETIRYPRNNSYTLEIVNCVEEYDRGIRENSNRR